MINILRYRQNIYIEKGRESIAMTLFEAETALADLVAVIEAAKKDKALAEAHTIRIAKPAKTQLQR